MDAALLLPDAMTAEAFLAWDPGDGQRWQLVDGRPVAMAPANRTHGAIQAELSRLIGNHLLARPGCSVVTGPGIIPGFNAATNVRIPDLAVTCSPFVQEEPVLADPVLLVEILSPGNEAETWSSIWTYPSLPSVMEILVVRTVVQAATVLRRQDGGAWPRTPAWIGEGTLTLDSIGLSIPLADLYRTTRLARSTA